MNDFCLTIEINFYNDIALLILVIKIFLALNIILMIKIFSMQNGDYLGYAISQASKHSGLSKIIPNFCFG